ncbi:MAG: hypothetical protein IKN71_04535 [Alphaproteobacteria bacterium]|nr:hypothetical protein [Alphaproteobacteria bacterium]
MSILSNDQQKALRELFIILEKGVDLLANENLDKDLYEAFEKYADSTIKMVNEAYMSYNDWSRYYTNKTSIFRSNLGVPTLNSAASVYASYLSQQINPSVEYREKLKNLLQRLILLAQRVIYE